MIIHALNQLKVPIIVLDKKLEQFRGKVLFPKKTGFPKLRKYKEISRTN